MPRLTPRQSQTIDRFLSLARRHIGLRPRRRMPWAPLRRVRQGMLRTLLIAGSFGGLFGNTAYAGNNEISQSEPRSERSANGQTLSAESACPAALERMP